MDRAQNDNQIDPKWREQISKNWGNYCSSCGSLKEAESLKFIKKLGIAHQYISECPNCGLKTVITLLPNIGMQVAQVRTDISPNEFEKFGSPITSNDYLEFYSNIKDVNSFDELMKYLDK